MKTRTNPLFFFCCLTLPSSLALLPPASLSSSCAQSPGEVTMCHSSKGLQMNLLVSPSTPTSQHQLLPLKIPRRFCVTRGVQDQARAEMIMKWGFFSLKNVFKPLNSSLCFFNSVLINQRKPVPDVQLCCWLRQHCLNTYTWLCIFMFVLYYSVSNYSFSHESVCQNVRLIYNIKIPSVVQSVSSTSVIIDTMLFLFPALR